ncbi:MAG: hypothetical protein IPM38_02805 [Ignavibacteria bacterium]|nr:hypothetical protein [Ignavibacteria bacterium]
MNISSQYYKKYITNFAARKLLVGRYQSYESNALLKFTNISPDYDSAVVISAKLYIEVCKLFL